MEDRTPDLIEALPVLRQVVAVEYQHDDTTTYRLISPLRPKDAWRYGEVHQASCKPMDHYWEGKVRHDPDVGVPVKGCTCGFYGCLPWAQGRWPGVTPMSSLGEDEYTIDPRPHPLVAEYTSFCFAGRGGVDRFCRIHAGRGAQRCALLLTVMGVGGKVITAESGVKAERATLVAAVDPLTIPVPHPNAWPQLLGPGLFHFEHMPDQGTRVFRYDWCRDLSAELLARSWAGPVISWDEAVKTSTDAWGSLRGRWDDVNHIAS